MCLNMGVPNTVAGWLISGTILQGGATSRARVAKLVYKWLNSMVYGRYNELVNGGFVMVYKPTNITGGGHPVLKWMIFRGTPMT